MRIAQKIIATFLALQLLVSFGLCGGLCCVLPRKTAATESEMAIAIQEDSLARHCPVHAEKARAEKAKKEQTARKARQLAKQGLKAKVPVSSFKRSNCCLVRANLPEGEISSVSASPQLSKLLVIGEPARWQVAAKSDRLLSSRPILYSPASSPPIGFQLSLRI